MASQLTMSDRRLSLERMAEAARRIDPVFLGSPQFVSDSLSAALGCRLTLKIETLNPIRCFKGRGADFLAGHLADRGETRPLVCASAGNFGQALAYACRKRGLALTVFAATQANPLKVDRMRALSAQVRLTGEDFDAAKDEARRFAADRNWPLIEDGLVPEISEGAGTIGAELLARGDAFDAVLVPLGNGALINGIALWFASASPSTRIIGVCSQGAPAMATAFRAGPGRRLETARADTIADGIAVRVPIAEAVADMHGVVDDVLLVDDAGIVEAMRLLYRHQDLVVGPPPPSDWPPARPGRLSPGRAWPPSSPAATSHPPRRTTGCARRRHDDRSPELYKRRSGKVGGVLSRSIAFACATRGGRCRAPSRPAAGGNDNGAPRVSPTSVPATTPVSSTIPTGTTSSSSAAQRRGRPPVFAPRVETQRV
jgi:threonine dehydratase